MNLPGVPQALTRAVVALLGICSPKVGGARGAFVFCCEMMGFYFKLHVNAYYQYSLCEIIVV